MTIPVRVEVIDALTIRDPEFSTLGMRIEGGVRVALAGTADARATGLLARLLPAVDAAAADTGAHRVELDFRALEFLSSSCFQALVTWIAAGVRGYAITLVSNPSVHWQRRSLYALSRFGGDLITLRTAAG